MNLRPVLSDVLLAVVLTALTAATLAGIDGGAGWVAHLVAALTVAPVALRQWAPVLVMVVVVSALAAFSLLGFGTFPNGGVGMLIGMFTVATLRPRWVAAVVFLAATVAEVFCFSTLPHPFAWAQVVQAVLVTLGAWVLGESTRRWGERTERLAEKAARAVADERVRIARELHDVVAHHMSVISLQAGVARYVLDTDLPTARTALDTVAGTSREALAEMRHLLDVLRVDTGADDTDADADDTDLSPQPGLAMLDELVERTRGAGLPVEVVVTGEVRELPPGPDLCAYRVAQESLTNVLKHAGPASARVELDYGERTLTLRVTDDGTASRSHRGPVAASYGIRGMRERAELYGGVLDAGPGEHGGFAVSVRLPVSGGAL
ncbi:sensor histidine kinase [Umezawaea beigongshangensis]|uniref:sensor histidine kinase n=1 Tax=Umezawaea beigongshangensis TaxID=2780383 RepID=UPI0027DD7C97|nr:sensor histidine kinase [Umezawaea beigongshangensis]